MSLSAAFAVLLAAGLGGALLLASPPFIAARVRPVAALHGLVGGSGLAFLALAPVGRDAGVRYGVAGFPKLAMVLVALALLLGLGLLGLRQSRRRVPIFLAGIHATLAMGGIALLASFLALVR